MQGNLNRFDHISTSMLHMQPEEKKTTFTPCTENHTKLSLVLHLANLTIFLSSWFLLPSKNQKNCSHEVLWKAGQGSHQHHHPKNPGPTPICITPPHIHRWCNLYCTLHCPFPPGQKEQLLFMRMLFIDYSSAFNTIVLSKLITKLRTLGLNTSLDFLTGHPQVVRVGCNTSATLNTGVCRAWLQHHQ